MEHNDTYFRRHGVHVVIVNGSSVQEDVPLGTTTGTQYQVLRVPLATFNRALARNIGITVCSTEWLMFLDADIIFAEDIFACAEPLLDVNTYITIHRVREAIPELVHKSAPEVEGVSISTYYEETIAARGRSGTIHLQSAGNAVRCGSGLILCRRNHCIKVGGFDSRLQGYGYEDLDLQLRLQMTCGLQHRMVGEVIHLTRPMSSKENAERLQQAMHNKLECLQKYAEGRLLGTYEQDSREWKLSLTNPSLRVVS